MGTREEVAYHEAGHVLGFVLLGRRFERVIIEKGDKCYTGRVDPIPDGRPFKDRWHYIVRWMTNIVSAWSGQAAEFVEFDDWPAAVAIDDANSHHMNIAADALCEYAAQDEGICKNNVVRCLSCGNEFAVEPRHYLRGGLWRYGSYLRG